MLLASPSDAHPEVQESIDAGHEWRWAELALDVWIEPDLGRIHLEGNGRLRFAGETSQGPLLALPAGLAEFTSVSSPGAKIEHARAELAGQAVATVRIRAASPLAQGAELALEFTCDSLGQSDQFAVRPIAALASWVEAWYPCPVTPGVPLSSLLAASGSTRIHLPDGWGSVSNGAFEASTEEGVEVWRVEQPVARSFACAPFTTVTLDVDGREVGVHRLRAAREPADVELGAIAAILRALEARFGSYPYSGYRVAEVPNGVGDFLGSSEQGFIMVRPVAFDAPDGNRALFAHELAHGWWGNRVASNGPGSMLLSEGLAQFSAVVAIAAIESEAAAADFLCFSRPGYVDDQCARGFFQRWRRDWKGGKPGLTLAEIESGGEAHLLADSKGHWVLEMLRRELGDERLFTVLRGVVRDFAERPLTLPELRERCVAAAPERDVAGFLAQWLDRTGAPVLEHTFEQDGGRTRVRVRQIQPGEPYRLTLELALDSAAGRSLHTVVLEQSEHEFELATSAPVEAVVLDPHHRILRWMPEYGPKPWE